MTAVADPLALYVDAVAAADGILRSCFGLVRKAGPASTATPEQLDAAAVALSVLLSNAVRGTEAEVVKQALRDLDVDWSGMTAQQRNAVVQRAMKAAGRAAPRVAASINTLLDDAAVGILEGVRIGMPAAGVHVGVDFNAVDHRIVRHMRASTSMFVTDNFRQRAFATEAKVREAVAAGLARGLERASIAEEIATVASGLGRPQPYWDVVASSFVGQARSLGQLSSYAEAGIDRYQLEAVLDENTTEQCRFLHGKTFSVSRGLGVFRDVEKADDADAIRAAAPWLQVAGGKIVTNLGAGRTGQDVATIRTPGYGVSDRIGAYANARNADGLTSLGVCWPPFHAFCRTTTIAVVSG